MEALKTQAPNEASKQPATAALKKKKTQQCKQLAPKTAKEGEEAHDRFKIGVFIPGWGSDDSDYSSVKHGAEFSEDECDETSNVNTEASKKASPPQHNTANPNVSGTCAIAPVGRSWQNKQWKAQYRQIWLGTRRHGQSGFGI